LLNDRNTYEILNKDPLKDFQTKFNQNIKLILKDSPDLIKKFTSYMPSHPYFYGLPKIHKENIPLRPIISNVNSPTYQLSKWLVKILAPLLGKIYPSSIKNSEDFVNRISNLNLSNKRMMSFDVIALYTNVPTNLTINLLQKFLHENQTELEIPHETLSKLLKLCLNKSFFSFNNNFCKQKEGLAMGSPISSILANLFMEFFEKSYIGTNPDIITWFRYIDDVFVITNNNVNPDDLLTYLNRQMHTIKFTKEIEENNKPNFLDITIVRSNNGAPSFKIYRKPTNSNNYIHWFSGHSYNTKKGILISFFLRAFKICSPQYFDEEIDIIKRIFSSLGYPLPVIKHALKLSKNKFYNNNAKTYETKPTIILPYVLDFQSKNLLPKEFNYTTKYNSTIHNITFHKRSQLKNARQFIK
jgi:hypothetical protein